MEASKQTLYWPHWQALRVALLGSWNTQAGVNNNLNRLRQYYEESPSLDRAWRIVNLLNAVRMGYSGQGTFESVMSQLVVTARRDYTAAMKTFAVKSYSPPTEEDVLREWAEVPSAVRAKILTNLSNRLANHSDSAHREELRWFLRTISGFM